MPSELKFWAAALIQTLALPSSDQFGRKKYRNPCCAPSNVTARPKKIIIKMNGNVAVKYRTLADDFIDFQMAKYTKIHAHIKHATKSHRNAPAFSKPSVIWSTLFLRRRQKKQFEAFIVFSLNEMCERSPKGKNCILKKLFGWCSWFQWPCHIFFESFWYPTIGGCPSEWN